MPIDIFGDTLITITEATKLLPHKARGLEIHPTSVFRWAQVGLKSKDGMIVRLETVKVGGTVFTTKEALQRFFERLQSASMEVTPASPTSRERDARARGGKQEQGTSLSGASGNLENAPITAEQIGVLQEQVWRMMPDEGFEDSRAYSAVRHGIFSHAVNILAGEQGPGPAKEATLSQGQARKQ